MRVCGGGGGSSSSREMSMVVLVMYVMMMMMLDVTAVIEARTGGFKRKASQAASKTSPPCVYMCMYVHVSVGVNIYICRGGDKKPWERPHKLSFFLSRAGAAAAAASGGLSRSRDDGVCGFGQGSLPHVVVVPPCSVPVFFAHNRDTFTLLCLMRCEGNDI